MHVLTTSDLMTVHGGVLTLDKSQITYVASTIAQTMATLVINCLLGTPVNPKDFLIPAGQVAALVGSYDVCNRILKHKA